MQVFDPETETCLPMKPIPAGRDPATLPFCGAHLPDDIIQVGGGNAVCCLPLMCSGFEAGSYLRLIDSRITQLKAYGLVLRIGVEGSGGWR